MIKIQTVATEAKTDLNEESGVSNELIYALINILHIGKYTIFFILIAIVNYFNEPRMRLAKTMDKIIKNVHAWHNHFLLLKDRVKW